VVEELDVIDQNLDFIEEMLEKANQNQAQHFSGNFSSKLNSSFKGLQSS